MVRQLSGKTTIHLCSASEEKRIGDASFYQDFAYGVLARQYSPAKSGLLPVHQNSLRLPADLSTRLRARYPRNENTRIAWRCMIRHAKLF